MADIASTDVTYAMVDQSKEDSSFAKNVMTVAFGDSSLTYPSGGIPLLKGKMGVPNFVASAVIYAPDASNGYVYKYDQVNNKIRIYRGAGFTPAGTFTGTALAAHSHQLFVATGATDATGSTVNSVTGKFGISNAAQTHAGIAAASGAAGGVVDITAGTPAGSFAGSAVAAAALVEVTASSFAPAATTLYLEVRGW